MATLMNAGIQEICIISSPDYIPAYKKLFKNGRHLGLNISYEIQEKPEGIAQAFIIGKEFIGNDSVMLILGDNIFHGNIDYSFFSGAKVFAYEVSNPQDYGVVKFDKEGRATMLVEKPTEFVSKFAIPGLYIYDNEVIDIAEKLKPSPRGELEITDLNKEYLKNDRLYVSKLDRGFVWLDAGVPSTLHQAASYVETIQARQGIKIACLEEIALNKHFVNKIEFVHLLENLPNSEYKKYLTEIL
jgi:glucose-1-phosphate thymidylyltransferase